MHVRKGTEFGKCLEFFLFIGSCRYINPFLSIQARFCTQVSNLSPDFVYAFAIVHVGVFVFLGPIGNLLLEKEIEEMARNVHTPRMMSWIPWTQAPTQMHHVEAGKSLVVIFIFNLRLVLE